MKIFLVGMMGSGKSFLCKQLAIELKLDCYDLDKAIEKEQQTTITEIFNNRGEVFFRKMETEILQNFAHKNNFVLATGGGTACFNNNMQWMNEQGITIWLNEKIDTLHKRLQKGKENRPLIAALNNNELFYFLENKLLERNIFYEQARLRYNISVPFQNLLSNIIHYKHYTHE